MKHIIAYIKPHKLDAVTQALHRIDRLTGMTVLEVKGFGRGRKKEASLEEQLNDFVKHLKIEIFCKNELLDEIVTAIETSAHTGLRGDGKIYICGTQDAIRISTGERGEAAV
ncbi:MAG TPA: P-II family nitrogen regulator [Caldithrix abyssi]|uniref:P-II family nitrogen regulator n=1 Tax=Caldithrix abyssi TaxID=187145 RepID=A0A7V5UFU9_CALAY|nr:P-II family nitrogen regulator [Caldithrix abyssi]